MENNVISVVTITFNNFDELKTTLETLKEASAFESVVINGGICQKTRDYLTEHQIHGISEPDKGISDAFNKGIKYAHGVAVTFLNSGDSLIDPGYYQNAIEIFKLCPEVDFVYADIIFVHRDHGELLVRPNQEIGKTPFPHPSLIVRKYVFEKIGGFDINLKIAMDYDFMQRMLKAGYKGYYYDKGPVVKMDGLGVSSNHGLRGIAERELVLKKYGQMTFTSLFYLKKLRLKTYVRKFLQHIHLLNVYDQIKKKFTKIHSE